MTKSRYPTRAIRVALALHAVLMSISLGQAPREAVTLGQYLRESAVSKSVIDTFLHENSWAQFDAELGYILGHYMPRDGLDRSLTISTAQSNGQRTSFVYADRPCRINTYGNSFTQCHQVSDAETWQEYLAAHLGEPIRNFGMGGYGVYQAYRRMRREESRGHGAEYVILYIWGDDHIRSLLRCRHATFYRRWNHYGGKMFHNNFWPHVEMDLETGQWVERENRLSTPESLYKMTDADWMYENLKDDLALHMHVFAQGHVRDIDMEAIGRLAKQLGLPPAESASQTTDPRGYVGRVLDKYGLAATRHILTKARAFAESNRKKLLVVLFDPGRVLPQLIKKGTRYDQEVVDFLRENHFTWFDMNVVHVEDFKSFRIPYDRYRQRYFIGHYNPSGNHFFAFSIKDTIVNWLDPKPITYQRSEESMIGFEDYLSHHKNVDRVFVGRETASKEPAARVLRVPRTEDFAVNGKGDAPAWKKVDWEPLHLRRDDRHEYETRVKMLYSRTGLYVLMEAEDRTITATMKEDFLDLWTEDVFEFFLWPDERYPVYFEYEISPLGYELPILIPNFGGTFLGWRPWHYEGDRRTRKATTIVGGAKESGARVRGWKAEVFVPYEMLKPLQNAPPQPGTRWRANFYRVDYDDGKTTSWDWARVDSSFHEFDKFGTLIFE